ncbi:MAG: hypothetical protein WCV88_00640 [Patescibacteria group bacterium]|jgi:formylmethanofuran dehydrogenase subunit E
MLHCKRCQASFKIIPDEQALYKQLHVPEPVMCFNCRHADRTTRRRPYQLRSIQCSKCQKPIMTNSPRDMGNVIYCEQCFIESLI